jgi:hypothetical protein
MTFPSRRAALGAILAAPLASVPAVATSTISPALSRIIAEHDAHQATKDDWPDSVWPTEAERKEAGRLRALVAGYPSAGWPDTMAKAACLARLWPVAEAEDEVRSECEGGHAYLECMALAIACEVMRLGGATSCA